ERHEQGEGRAFAGRRANLELTADEARNLAADRQAKPGAAIFAAGRAIGLVERLEDQPLLLLRNADARVGYRNLDRPAGVAQSRLIAAPALVGQANAERDAALRGELEGVGQKVEHDLLQALFVRADRRRLSG